jgi:hypothetical protein
MSRSEAGYNKTAVQECINTWQKTAGESLLIAIEITSIFRAVERIKFSERIDSKY